MPRYLPFVRLLVGIEAGVLGGLATVGWLLLSSALLHHSAWTVPNLLGSLLDQNAGPRAGFGAATLAGLALQLFSTGVAGLLFSLLAGGIRSRRRVMILGVLVGLVWFYFFQAVAFRKLGALAWVYTPPRLLLAGHVIFGLVLGCYPWLLAAGVRPLPASRSRWPNGPPESDGPTGPGGPIFS
ncbi:MAG: hypothetical protein AAB225_12220 [Acidobacteriota bacterium]